MQKRLLLREGLELLILSAAACALLFFPETASAAVVRGLRQCGAAILPSLFPFFICANLITELSLTHIPARLLGRLMRPSAAQAPPRSCWGLSADIPPERRPSRSFMKAAVYLRRRPDGCCSSATTLGLRS